MFSDPAILKKTVFRHFAVTLSQLTFFQLSVKNRSDTSFLWKPFEFYFLLNLFIPLVLQLSDFDLLYSYFHFFSNKFLKTTFCPRKFQKMLIVAKFLIIYSDSFFLCSTIMGFCRYWSLLNKPSVNNCWGFSRWNPRKIFVKSLLLVTS